MNVCLAIKNDVFEIAKIHEKEISEGFLSSLKTVFLYKFYEAIISSKHSFCVVAKEENVVVGFVSGVTNVDYFYRYFFKNYFFILIPIFVKKIFNFRIVKKIFETIFYPQKIKDLPKAELLTFAVKEEFQRQGIGGQLLQKFISEMEKRKVQIFKVLVGKEMNSVGFYTKNGFQKIGEINLHSNETSIIFIYKII